MEKRNDLHALYGALRNKYLDGYKNKKWKEYIKSMPCVKCGAPADDPHHILGSVHGLKSSDLFCVPVCRGCHQFYENNPTENHWLILETIKIQADFIKQVYEQIREA